MLQQRGREPRSRSTHQPSWTGAAPLAETRSRETQALWWVGKTVVCDKLIYLI
jgi:hypothetical protein